MMWYVTGLHISPCMGYFTSPDVDPDRRDKRLIVSKRHNAKLGRQNYPGFETTAPIVGLEPTNPIQNYPLELQASELLFSCQLSSSCHIFQILQE